MNRNGRRRGLIGCRETCGLFIVARIVLRNANTHHGSILMRWRR